MTTVAIKKCAGYEDLQAIQTAIDNAVRALGGWEKFVKPGDKVLLKPNLIAPRRPEEAATTHPEVLRAIVRSLRVLGCEVWIGDSAGGAIAGVAPTAQALKVAGYAQVCEEEGAQLVNFDRAGTVPVKSRTGRFFSEFHIARPVQEADVVINVPKLKVHSNGGYTGAVKNTFGCIPGLRKAEYHRIAPQVPDFAELIADIHLACRVSLSIMDAVVGMEGAGPTNGTPKHVGLLLASSDPLALDTVASSIIGLNPGSLEFLRAADRLGVGQADISAIRLAGDFDSIPRVDFALPPSVNRPRKTPRWLLPTVIAFFKTRPQVDHKVCRRCGICRNSCPVDAIDDAMGIDREKCIECLCCQELCPHGAVQLVRVNPLARRLMPIEKTLERGHR